MNKSFSEKIKEYRKELSIKRSKKVTQIELAKELGITKGNIGDLESGRRLPSQSIIIKLVDHSGKSINYWMDGIQEYEAPNSVDLVLDRMIEKGLIKDTNLSEDVWEIIKKAVSLEVERKLK